MAASTGPEQVPGPFYIRRAATGRKQMHFNTQPEINLHQFRTMRPLSDGGVNNKRTYDCNFRLRKRDFPPVAAVRFSNQLAE